MKRKWISETIDNINPRYIEEAAEYTGKAKTTDHKVWYKRSAVAACFALVLAVGMWQLQLRKPAETNGDNTSPTGTVTPDAPVIWGTVSGEIQDAGYTQWNGKRVTMSLHTVLSDEKNKNSIIAVGLGFELDNKFVYNGKTIEEYNAEAERKQQILGSMGTLLKLGDELKYGEALYKTGTPDGKKWAKQFYDETVEDIGEDVLKTYIVAGEFLKDKLESNMENYTDHITSREACDEAIEAYYDLVAKQTSEQLRERNIPSEVRDGLIVYVTAAEFTSLEIDNVMFYSLAMKAEEGENVAETSTNDVVTEDLTQFVE